ncbi:MAG: hypothetical protein PHO07_12985 [Pirellulales bacterium]|nr:hypothetical protein [Pirellulales bacterium]
MAATELGQTPTTVEAPDTVAAPEDATATSSVLATPIEEEGEAASHWDTGPIHDETPCDEGDRDQEEYLRITGAYDSYVQYGYGDEYAYDAEYGYGEEYVYDAEDGYSAEYADDAEDGHENEPADSQTGAESSDEVIIVEDLPEEWQADAYGGDDDYEGYGYGYEDESSDSQTGAEPSDEVIIVEDLPEEWQADAYGGDDDYEGYGYGYEDESSDSQTGAEPSDEVLIVEDLPEEWQADAYGGDDDYEGYGYGCEDESSDSQTGAEPSDEVLIVEDLPEERPADASVYDVEDCYEDADYAWDEEAATTAEEQSAVGEDDFSYEFDDYKTHYGYEADELNAMEEEAIADAEDEVTADPAEEPIADAEDAAVDPAEEPIADAEDTAAVDPAEEWEPYSYERAYDYADPAEHYGCRYEYGAIEAVSSEISPPAEDSRVAVDLFSRQPSEVLEESDWALMRTLESLHRQPGAERRMRLNDYLESLGFAAIDFAYRFEDSSDSDVLALADDLASVATLLACYRLVERDEVDVDQAVDLLQRSLSGVTLDWIEAVGRGTASPDAESQADGSVHPVVGALAAVTNRSIATLEALAAGVAAELAEMPWTELASRLDEVRSAAKPVSGTQSVSR